MATLPVEPFGMQSPSKFQPFTFLGQKLTDVPSWSTNLNLYINLKKNIIVAKLWFL